MANALRCSCGGAILECESHCKRCGVSQETANIRLIEDAILNIRRSIRSLRKSIRRFRRTNFQILKHARNLRKLASSLSH